MNPPTEAAISGRFAVVLARLAAEDRCVWRAEVRLLGWSHAAMAKMDSLRADYVLTLDGGPLLAVDVKRPPATGADIGRAHEQARQYAGAVVAAQALASVVPAWVQQPIRAAFLLYDSRHLSAEHRGPPGKVPSVAEHMAAAARLFGPGGVGFVRWDRFTGLRLDLGGDRWWSERDSYREGALDRGVRVGSRRQEAPQ